MRVLIELEWEYGMKEAVIVSTARTPIAKAYRGGFNMLKGASLRAGLPVTVSGLTISNSNKNRESVAI